MVSTKKMLIFVILSLLLLLMVSGCTAENDKKNIEGSVSSPGNDEQKMEDNTQKPQEEQEQLGNDDTETQMTQTDDTELDESLAAYREERETMTGVNVGNGLSGYGAPDEEDYGLDAGGLDYSSRFDSRELNEAYEVAKKYVVETLGIEVETKSTVYPCIDPRISVVYEDKNKGVASGYEADNIFICEYCDNENWQYLFLVRNAKGEAWSVIYHGDSYQG